MWGGGRLRLAARAEVRNRFVGDFRLPSNCTGDVEQLTSVIGLKEKGLL
jgi:hypothetical protein